MLLTEGGKVNNWLAGWTADGTSLEVASNREAPEAMHCYLLSTAGAWKRVAANRGVGTIQDTSKDGQRALVSRLVSRGSNDLFLVDLASGAEVLLTPHEGPGSFSGVLGRDGRTVYLATNAGRDLLALGRVVVGAARSRRLSRRSWRSFSSRPTDRRWRSPPRARPRPGTCISRTCPARASSGA
jgi:hypothetical protein